MSWLYPSLYESSCLIHARWLSSVSVLAAMTWQLRASNSLARSGAYGQTGHIMECYWALCCLHCIMSLALGAFLTTECGYLRRAANNEMMRRIAYTGKRSDRDIAMCGYAGEYVYETIILVWEPETVSWFMMESHSPDKLGDDGARKVWRKRKFA